MKVTTNDLKTAVYGTPCGCTGEKDTSLSKPLVIDFIDTFFGGVLDNVDIYEDDETNSILISQMLSLIILHSYQKTLKVI